MAVQGHRTAQQTASSLPLAFPQLQLPSYQLQAGLQSQPPQGSWDSLILPPSLEHLVCSPSPDSSNLGLVLPFNSRSQLT